jgi:hypothetical protein
VSETSARVKEALGAVQRMGRTIAGEIKDGARCCKNLREVDAELWSITQQIAAASSPAELVTLSDKLKAVCQRKAAMEEKVGELEALGERVEREILHHTGNALAACQSVFHVVASLEAVR